MTEHILTVTAAPQAANLKLLCTRPEAAASVSCSVRTLDSLIANKELRAIRVGRSVRISIEALARFIKSNHATTAN